MKHTLIQWCHSTINPVMGCNGCELWKSATAIKLLILKFLIRVSSLPKEQLQKILLHAVADRDTGELYTDRKMIAQEMAEKAGLDMSARSEIVDIIRRACKCYAGLLGTNRGGNKGYADKFESPKLFPGRMAPAANWGLPSAAEIEDSPWLEGLPRLIFVSDMGDAMSSEVPFDFLLTEIIENVSSAAGRRHIWLWLTKLPARMAEFGAWLAKRGIAWPDNLVAITTVTEQNRAGRVDQLRKVPSLLKGISIEPLFGQVNLDLEGIDWVIVGGGSDVLAEPFHVEWALDLQRQCKVEGVAFFLKQLGHNAFFEGKPMSLADRHGGDWSEWQEDWRVREFPKAFRDYVPRQMP